MGAHESKITTERTGPINWKDLVKPGQVTMFSKSTCPFCKNSKKVLEENQIKFTAYETDLEWTAKEIEALKIESHYKTFPNIWIGENQLGGNSELEAAVANGKLYQLLDLENISYKRASP